VLITNVPLTSVQAVQEVYNDWRLRTRIEHGYRFDQEQGLAAIITICMSLSFAFLHPFPFQEFTCGCDHQLNLKQKRRVFPGSSSPKKCCPSTSNSQEKPSNSSVTPYAAQELPQNAAPG